MSDKKLKGKIKCLNGIDKFLFDFNDLYQENDKLWNGFLCLFYTTLCKSWIETQIFSIMCVK